MNESSDSRLAAIFFTDLVGYTSLMGKDDKKAMKVLHLNRQLHSQSFEKYGGVFVKEMGDGVMAYFSSAYNAIKCALELQKNISEIPADIQLRIGIHFGQAIFENEDVFGDTVNIASRLESLSDPDGIYVSQQVIDEISEHKDIQSVFVGKAKLKNVRNTVNVYAIQGDNLPIPSVKRFKRLAQYRRISLEPSTIFLVLFIPLTVVSTVIIFFTHRAKIKGAIASLDEIEQLVESNWRDFTEPYRMARDIEKVLTDNPRLQDLISKSSVKINVTSDPPGAKAYIKEYVHPESDWEHIGNTPIDQVRLPKGLLRWKLVKEGYNPTSAIAFPLQPRKPGMGPATGKYDLQIPKDFHRTLDKVGSSPIGMTRVPGYEMSYGKLDDFFIDICEVTNQQFKEFIDQGGYHTQEYWNYEFHIDGDDISWVEAMTLLVDQTGKPGPSTWQNGSFPEGKDNFPVTGLSWYEAMAYAEAKGKSLPTKDHWGLARGDRTLVIDRPFVGGMAFFSPSFNNFSTEGPVEVGSLPGMTSYGALDMPGNAREWCYNDTPRGKLIRGGAWNTHTYAFHTLTQASAMDRSPTNGFRCVQYLEPDSIPKMAMAPLSLKPRLNPPEKVKPISEEVFEILKSRYSYDGSELNAKTEERIDKKDWILEKVTFNAAYGKEEVIVYLFLPKNVKSPYQSIIYVPGAVSFVYDNSDQISEYYEFPVFLDFIVKQGRAVIFPIYKGTFERSTSEMDSRKKLSAIWPNPSHEYADFFIQTAKDFRRTVDYLVTRDDIDPTKIGLYGMSWGATVGPLYSVIEPRVKANVLVASALRSGGRPEVEIMNFLPRMQAPTLIINGEYDSVIPGIFGGQKMYENLGLPDEDKKLYLSKSDHIPNREDLVRETTIWYDKYMGSVTIE